jgi:DNA (cytosine-5)-methyltransferase 1
MFWVFRVSSQAKSAVLGQDEPAPTLAPGHDAASMRWYPEGTTQSGTAQVSAEVPQSRRLSVGEAAALQTFPAGYPWEAAPTQGKRYLGIGNAVPPLLWRAVLREIER